MKSIYERVLGADFHRLHPKIQRRFGFSSSDGIASIGTGVMDEIWKGRLYTEPFLRVGSWRRIMFPETGRDIPFTIENYAFVDRFGYCFGYRGSFNVEWRKVTDVPGHILPKRQECRD